jgi:cytochrome P450
MFDGPQHLALKTMALTAFDHHAIEGYLPQMQDVIERTLARLSGEAPFAATREMRRLAIEAVCWNVMGIPPGPETEAFTRDYGTLLAGLATLPVKVPGTPYAKAMQARDRLLGRIRAIVDQRRAAPGNDGLSTILAARMPDGRGYTDGEAVLEVHHVVVAGFIVYALMAEVLRRLAAQPDLAERCLDEVSAHAPAGSLSMEGLGRLETCTNVVLEAKRIVPLVPLAFGRARRAFTCGGFEVPEGWTVWLALHLMNLDPDVYPDPGRFDPDRFGPDRREHETHPMAFIPQGSEPPTSHRCLGLDYSTFLTVAFLALAVRGHTWDLPAQDLAYDWTRRPPEPKDGIRVRLRPR